MKISLISLMASTTMAQAWKAKSYCDYDQYVVDELTSTDKTFNQQTCWEWCLNIDTAEGTSYSNGADMCCDFEAWVDGSFNCYLYSGGLEVPQDMNDYPEDSFSSIVFPHLMPAAVVEETEGAKYLAIGVATVLMMSNIL